MSSFYAFVGSAECWDIQILTIRYFNSFGFFWDTLYVPKSSMLISTLVYTTIQYYHENSHELVTGFWYIYERAYEILNICIKIQYAQWAPSYMPKSSSTVRILMSVLLDFGIYMSVLMRYQNKVYVLKYL
jgi:hypothetical protein